jgi:LmbE family N-acetylglucosaminyl deacetylase
VREHHFLNQRDSGFSGDAAEAGSGNWDRRKVLASLVELLDREHYDFVFTLLPTAETHGHHRAATRLALEAAAQLAERDRPAVLGAEPGQSRNPPVRYAGLAESREFRTLDPAPVLTFDRTASFGYNRALNYQIVVNWVIAEHKSQGLFQSDYGRHDVEQFWLFAGSGREALSRTQALGRNLNSTAHQVAIG